MSQRVVHADKLSFNISKGKKPLADFLAQVPDFANHENKKNEWAAALSFSEAHLLPDVADLDDLADQIKIRETLIRDTLVAFVNGSATRVDMK